MEVEFNDPTEELNLPKFNGYTIVVCKSLFSFDYHHVNTLEEVHEIISKVEDYYYHKQNQSVDPYKYIVITRRYYNQIGVSSLFF